MDIELPNDFKEFLRLLNAHQVEYLVIGGYAVSFHGYPRATNGFDIWVALNPDNAQKLVVTLEAFGFSVSELTPLLFQKPEQIIRLGSPPIRIELHTGISGLVFEECYPSRLIVPMDGVLVQLISLSDLRKNKRANGRHKDLSDLEYLP